MSVADSFCAGFKHGSNLSPGSMTQVVYVDPISTGLISAAALPYVHKVDLPEAKARAFMERIWNLETWDVQFSVNWSLKYTDPTPPNIDIYDRDVSITGQFSGAFLPYYQGAIDDFAGGAQVGVFRPAPRDRVTADQFLSTHFDAAATEYSITQAPMISPIISYGLDGYDGFSDSLDIKEESSGPTLGGVAIAVTKSSATGFASALSLVASYVWLKSDGTCSVYFSMNMSAESSGTFAAQITNSTGDLSGSGYGDLGAISLSFFGETVAGKAWLADPIGGGATNWTLDAFTFSYDLGDVTLYTYPGD